MQNPFRPSTEAELPAASTRGPSFNIKSGDQVFSGRPVNASYCKHLFLSLLDKYAQESARIMHDNFDAIEQRLSYLETELGVDPSEKGVQSGYESDVGLPHFRSARLGGP